ncbi:MAG TPA: hypothetical protein VGG04_18775 [Candidatus Sulfotelmatobacter sp.]|jgi:hypothetical protein
MKSRLKNLAFLLCLFYAASCFSIDREALSITKYDLNAQIDPEQHRLGVRGKITLRNDSASAQKNAVLQISSSLDWRVIKAGGKPVQYLTQTLTSDIDHTGALSEAIVTLPQAVEPHGSIELEIGYEGVIVLDATRLTRIGAPESEANISDWDQIGIKFTALRGAGYVAWYPIVTDVANLSEDNSLSDVLARWKAREVGSRMHLSVDVSQDAFSLLGKDSALPTLLFNGVLCQITESEHRSVVADCAVQPLRLDTPAIVIADYKVLERKSVEVRYLPGHNVAATDFADAAEKIAPLVSEWFGAQRERAKTAELPIIDAAPFESGALLLTPFANSDSKLAGLSAAHQLTHASFLSFRPWIEEGLAHFAQALYLEQQKGKPAALDYMSAHRTALNEIEKTTSRAQSADEAKDSLVNTTNEELYRSKAMCVWWMLRDMVGDAVLKKVIAAYRPEQDKDPSYVQRLLSAQTERDLEWFFDDWVYRDRGLPDFKVESVFARKTLNNSYMLTVTVDNLGAAGAEVPVIIKFAGGEMMKRLEVHARDKATTRIETPGAPQEIRVNDGSVPESDVTNNTFKVEAPAN